MWRKSMLLVLCAALLLGMAVGCSGKADADLQLDGTQGEGFRRTVLFLRSDEGFVVPVMKLIPWEEGIGRAATEQLIATPEHVSAAAAMGLNPTLNDGAQVSLRIRDNGLAELDIMNPGEYASAAQERAMVDSVVCTLLQFSSIESVQLLFDGKVLRELEHGTRVQEPFDAIRLNSEADAVQTGIDGAEYNAITLYFPNQACSLNVPVTRYIRNIRTFENAVRELVAGPTLAGLRQCYPQGTHLLACSIAEGIAAVEFSQEFREILHTPGLYEAVYESIALTASEYGAVSQLQISAGGLLDPPEGASLPQYANQFR